MDPAAASLLSRRRFARDTFGNRSLLAGAIGAAARRHRGFACVICGASRRLAGAVVGARRTAPARGLDRKLAADVDDLRTLDVRCGPTGASRSTDCNDRIARSSPVGADHPDDRQLGFEPAYAMGMAGLLAMAGVGLIQD
jgi:hypothetical protein